LKRLLGHHAVVTGTRVLAGVVGLMLLGIGLATQVMPEVVSTYLLALTTAADAGINSLRGDIGALFLGMGVFTLLGVFSRQRWLLLVPIVFLGLVVLGRLISIAVDDFAAATTMALAMELLFVIVLSLALGSHALSPGSEPRPAVVRAVASRGFLITTGVLVVLLAGGLVLRPQLGAWLWERATAPTLASSPIEDLPDGIHVGFAGTGAPMPDMRRAGSSVFVLAGEHLFIVDSGPGSTVNLEAMKVPLEEIDAVLLTHHHSDHIAGLGELMLKAWTNGARTEPLPVMGPEGVDVVVEGFNMAFGPDAEHRHAHHGDAVAPQSGFGGSPQTITGFGGDDSTVVFENDEVIVTAFLVDHRPIDPALGYRFDYKGRSVVISGDTLPDETLMHEAQGVDLLVHEAESPEMLTVLDQAATTAGEEIAATVARDIRGYHTFPEEAARIARDADVGHLVLTHLLPPLPVSVLHPTFLGDSADIYSGPITVAGDGMLFSMPPDSTDIQEQWLLR
jgi:ribonuclease Z